MDDDLSEDEIIAWKKSNYHETQLDKVDFREYVSTTIPSKKAPKFMNIDIWVWDMECYSCHKPTPVVFPEGEFFGYSVSYNSLKNLPRMLSERYPSFKTTQKLTQQVTDYGNTCIHCGAYQGDFFVFEDYLDVAYNPELIKEKIILEVPLTDDERIYYAD